MDIRGCTDNSTWTSAFKRISARTVRPGLPGRARLARSYTFAPLASDCTFNLFLITILGPSSGRRLLLKYSPGQATRSSPPPGRMRSSAHARSRDSLPFTGRGSVLFSYDASADPTPPLPHWGRGRPLSTHPIHEWPCV